jgi:hypothetical protein
MHVSSQDLAEHPDGVGDMVCLDDEGWEEADDVGTGVDGQ